MLPEAAEVPRAAGLDPESIEVAVVGARPAWLDDQPASTSLASFSITSSATPATRVVHVARRASASVGDVRAAHPGAAVAVDVGHVDSASQAELLDAAAADLVLVESELDAELACARQANLDGRLRAAPAPVDLALHVPEDELLKLQAAYVKRFRRLHRLAHPAVLFVGPYTPSGGLDLAIEAAYRLRRQFESVRLAAVPLGSVDPKYLDRCEMEALGLGHRGIVEWTTTPEDLRCWYATATVVCCPWREPAEAPEAPILAAAAARPFVGSDLPIFRRFRDLGATTLVPAGDVDALVESVSPLLADLEQASLLGRNARATVKEQYSYAAASQRLASVWSELAAHPRLESAP